MKKLFLLTGEVNTGKTSHLKKWIEKYRSSVNIDGVLSPVINGRRYFEFIETGFLLHMESPGGNVIETGRYKFSADSFQKTRKYLSGLNPVKDQWIIIDEFGKLELKDEGLNPVITPLIHDSSDINLLIVIRKSLLSDFIKKYSLSQQDYYHFSFQNPVVPVWLLAGGSSSRMGQNKALLKTGDKTLIQFISDKCRKHFSEIKISGNEKSKYEFTGLEIVEDVIKGYGAFSGLHSALTNSNAEIILVVTCDMPLISDDLLLYFSNTDRKTSGLVFRYDNFIHPFPGLYSKKLLPLFNENIAVSDKKLKSIVSILKSAPGFTILESDELKIPAENFFNMNTPQDFDFVAGKLARQSDR